MLLKDLIIHTRSILPLFDNRFTTNTDIINISKSGDTVSVNANDHELSVGDQIIISGVKTNITITNITTSNGLATVTCSADHDLTFGYTLYAEITSAEPSYDGRFKILSVPTPLTFTFAVSGSPSDNTGILKTFHNLGFNGVHIVSNIVDTDNFEYELQNDNLAIGSGDSMLVMSAPRISGAAILERAIDTYTKYNANQLYGFFVFDNMVTSDDQTVNNDSKNERTQFEDYKLRLINNVIFYVFIPTHNQTSARKAIDTAQELAKPIYKTLAGLITPNEFKTDQQTMLMPSSHSVAGYTTSYLIYQYDFQNTEFLLSQGESDNQDDFMANTGDTLANLNTRALRSFNKWNLKNDFAEIVKSDLINI